MPAENSVEVHRLKKSVGQGEQELSILTGVELVVKRAETIALIGESGSGKSTLLAILAGLDDGSSGEVHLVGQPLHQLDEEARAALRARHIGFVFQSFMLIPTLNALENVELPALLRGCKPSVSPCHTCEQIVFVALDSSGQRGHWGHGGGFQKLACKSVRVCVQCRSFGRSLRLC